MHNSAHTCFNNEGYLLKKGIPPNTRTLPKGLETQITSPPMLCCEHSIGGLCFLSLNEAYTPLSPPLSRLAKHLRLRGKAACLKTYTFYSRYVYVSLGKAIRLALSPSKLPFSNERYTSPQEITFVPAPHTFQAHTRLHLAPTKRNIRSDVVASAT